MVISFWKRSRAKFSETVSRARRSHMWSVMMPCAFASASAFSAAAFSAMVVSEFSSLGEAAAAAAATDADAFAALTAAAFGGGAKSTS
ncbi:hypothetical protein B0H34DRAFT_716618 [Crassisporium funariophilum]|nr:hypothetical protein B0H34DRAFT_716618 [Crassisporium funariophilum]